MPDGAGSARPLAADDEADLLDRVVAGDETAFATLIARHGPAVAEAVVIAPRWAGQVELEDVLQVTYLEAFLAIREHRLAVRSLRGWLVRAAENNLRDAIAGLRRAKRPNPDRRLAPGPGEDPLEWLHRQATSGGTTPSRRCSREEMHAALDAEIERLPTDYAEVVRLAVLRGMGHDAVGARLGRSRGAVWLIQQRAIDRLRRRMIA